MWPPRRGRFWPQGHNLKKLQIFYNKEPYLKLTPTILLLPLLLLVKLSNGIKIPISQFLCLYDVSKFEFIYYLFASLVIAWFYNSYYTWYFPTDWTACSLLNHNFFINLLNDKKNNLLHVIISHRAELKLLFVFLNQNICCRYSKEPSQWDGSFEYQNKYV